MTPANRWFATIAAVWLSACSTSPRATQTAAAETPGRAAAQPASQSSPPQAVPACVAADTSAITPQARQTITALQRNIEAGPLFAAASSAAAVASCRIGFDDGMASLEYQFKDGGWLRAKRNQAIEHSDFEVHFATAPADDPIAILTRAERAAFGDEGCGIDWKDSESRPATGGRGATDKIFRGDSCNCQARVRSDANGRVVGLILRSAC